MTSKNSFFSALKEDKKRRIWTLVLFCLVCFLMTAAFELNLESMLNRLDIGRELFIKDLVQMIRDGWITLHLVMGIVAACFYGFQGFGWLSKKRKVDFYHSQPMKREKRFLVIYIDGLLMYVIPMLCHVLLCILLTGLRGYFCMEITNIFLWDLLLSTLAFLLTYHLVILAVMLTGNLIVAGMIFAVLYSYAYVCKELFELFFSTFFDSYAHGYTDAMGWMSWLSPIIQLYQGKNVVSLGLTGETVRPLLCLFLMVTAGFAVSFFLYKKRPSEAAEHALAYDWAGDIIRFLIVVISGMLCGLMFCYTGNMTLFWLYFGTILGVLLAHGTMETIFQFDIKSCLKKKKQLLISGILVIGIVSAFRFDLLGYDRYLPKADQVEKVSYFIDIGDFYNTYQVLTDEGIPKQLGTEEYGVPATESYGSWPRERATISYNISQETSQIYRDDYQLSQSETSDVKPILALIQAHLDWEQQGKYDPEEDGMTELLVHYEMKSGRDVYRQYYVSDTFLIQNYSSIYDTEQGRRVVHPYWNLSSDKIDAAEVYIPWTGMQEMSLTEQEIEELVNSYKNDLTDQTIEQLLNEKYLGEIYLIYEKSSSGNTVENMTFSLCLGESYDRVNQFLKQKGIYTTVPNESYVVTEGMLFNPYDSALTTDHSFWKGRSEVNLTAEQIEQLLPYMMAEEYMVFQPYEDNMVSGIMKVKNKTTGELLEVYCHILEKDIPGYTKVEE